MPPDPPVKRTVVFVDGQNLFHAAREAFGYTYPNYDIRALAERMCAGRGWQLTQARFYTGIPDAQDDPRWHHFWSAKLAVMGRQDVHVYSRSLRYRNRTVHLPDGTTHTFLAGEEKGIDVRIALDIIRMAHRGAYDVGLVLSQDQDLSWPRRAAGSVSPRVPSDMRTGCRRRAAPQAYCLPRSLASACTRESLAERAALAVPRHHHLSTRGAWGRPA